MYGGELVPLLERKWPRRESLVPYYRSDLLKPGENWRHAMTHGGYTENYVQLADGPIPVGVMIARELRAEGANIALCTELPLGRLRLIDPELWIVEAPAPLAELLATLRTANGGSFAGLPDAVALFPDGRIVFREAKVKSKDRLSRTQHAFAPIARQLLGKNLDLAVVEWGSEVIKGT
jgi:hypothetical protein